jgi:hypothetical protein
MPVDDGVKLTGSCAYIGTTGIRQLLQHRKPTHTIEQISRTNVCAVGYLRLFWTSLFEALNPARPAANRRFPVIGTEQGLNLRIALRCFLILPAYHGVMEPRTGIALV